MWGLILFFFYCILAHIFTYNVRFIIQLVLPKKTYVRDKTWTDEIGYTYV